MIRREPCVGVIYLLVHRTSAADVYSGSWPSHLYVKKYSLRLAGSRRLRESTGILELSFGADMKSFMVDINPLWLIVP